MNTTTLNNLKWRVCGAVDKTTRYNEPYKVVSLSRTDEQIDVYVWSNSIVDDGALELGAVVSAALRSGPRGNRDFVSAKSLHIATATDIEWLELLPRSSCADVTALDELLDVISSLQFPTLRRFAGQILGDAIGYMFVTVPASYSFHHAHPSGLLAHSVDCARRFQATAAGFTECERAVGTLAALFHDIGKARTLDQRGRKTSLGNYVHHDALTLETCAPALRDLDLDWSWAAQTLRQIWTWRTGSQGDWRKQPCLAVAVSASDRLSSELDKRAASLPSHHEPVHAAC